MRKWYVVHTHVNGERKASSHLERQGFHVYFPQYLKQWRHARKTEMRPTPLFPRYLFISMDVSKARWHAIKSTIGVSGLICHGNTPTPVPDEIINEIQENEDESGFFSVISSVRFKRGDPVAIVEGALSGVVGFFECTEDKDRVTLLLEMLGRSARVKLPMKSISPAT